jgi:hypothetical protein
MEARQMLTLTPIATPFSVAEGPGIGAVVGEFSDSSGNTDPSVYGTVTTNWGDGGSSYPSVTSLGGGLFAINDMHMAAAGTIIEAGTYTVTSTVGGITITSQATVADAALSSSGLLLGAQATAGVLFSGDLGSYTDASGGPGTDLSGLANWGDGTAPTPVTLSNGQVWGSHIYQYQLSGTFAISISITDLGGSTTSFGDTITVSSPVSFPNPPGPQTGTEGQRVSLTVQANDSTGAAVTFSGAGLPTGLSINANGTITGTIAAGAAVNSPFQTTITATDTNGASASTTFPWTVDPNPVSFPNPPGPQTGTEGQQVSLQVQADDSNGAALSYGAAGLPPGLGIDDNGTISGTIAIGDAANSPFQTTITATDTNGASASTTFDWYVNPAPADTVSFTNPPGPQTNNEGDAVWLQVQATSSSGAAVTYSGGGLPPGLSIDPNSGAVSGTIAIGDSASSPFTTTITATDGTASASTTFAWYVNPPALDTVTVTSPGNLSNEEGQQVALQVQATSSAGLAFTGYGAAGLPPGLNFDPVTGDIWGTIATGAAANGPYQVTFSATDASGASASTTFTWAVSTPTPDTVTVTSPGNLTNNEGDAVLMQVHATSSAGLAFTSYGAAGLPPGLNFDPDTGDIWGTIATGAAANGPYQVTFSATDASGASASTTFTWAVNPATSDTVSITNPGTQINNEGDPVSLQVQASSSSGAALTYSAAGLPAGLSIDRNSGDISGTIATGDSANSPFTTTITATDGTASASTTFAWYVNPPALDTVTVTSPGSLSNEEGQQVTLQVQATSSAGLAFTSYGAAGLPPGLNVNPDTGDIWGTIATGAAASGPYQVTLSATDASGASGSATFTWDVTTATPDTVTVTPPGNLTNNEGDPVLMQVQASSSNNFAITGYGASGLPAGLNFDPTTGEIWGTIATGAAANGPYQVTLSATDASGASGSASFTWAVNPSAVDTVNIINPGPQSNNEGDTVGLQVQASSSSGAALTYSAAGMPPGLSIDPNSGGITGTITAGDSASSPFTTTIKATDGTASASVSFVWTVMVMNAKGKAHDYVVTWAQDEKDGGTNDNQSGPDGQLSLREAIMLSNANAAPAGAVNTISFNINAKGGGGTQTIYVDPNIGPLPTILAGVLIDGFSQPVGNPPAGPYIMLNGLSNKQRVFGSGLDIDAQQVTVQGLSIVNFEGSGIGLEPGSGNDQILGCNIGTDLSGSGAGFGNLSGVGIASSDNTIGGIGRSQNVISGNKDYGISINGTAGKGSGNLIVGNIIGLDQTGTLRLGNGGGGIDLSLDANNNTIGGAGLGQGNAISGNGGDGVTIESGANSNYLIGNLIGVNSGGVAPGTVALENTGNGITINGPQVDNNLIGGVLIGAGNTISGNTKDGISIILSKDNLVVGNLIGLKKGGAGALGNGGNGVTVDGASATGNNIGLTPTLGGNTISGNGQNGVVLTRSASKNSVWGDYIGLGSNGTTAYGNTQNGVVISNGAFANTIGDVGGEGDVIAGQSAGAGVLIQDSGSIQNQVLGCYIGTDKTGTNAVANQYGVEILSDQNTVGAAGAWNVISGDSDYGVLLTGADATKNQVTDNYIGTDPTGSKQVAANSAPTWNRVIGVCLDNGASANTIGSSTGQLPANVISGNNIGVDIRGFSNNNLLAGNYIGTDFTGENQVANVANGVQLEAGSNNTIGGLTGNSTNVISGNGVWQTQPNYGDGIAVWGSAGSGDLITGNYIGTDAGGTKAIPNEYDGVFVQAGAGAVTIGGTAQGALNVISGNGGNGIEIQNDADVVVGNYIGLGADGHALTGNASNVGDGVRIDSGATNNTIGGSNTAPNYIANNGGYGIHVTGTTNLIDWNSVGFDAGNGGALTNVMGWQLDDSGGNTNTWGLHNTFPN